MYLTHGAEVTIARTKDGKLVKREGSTTTPACAECGGEIGIVCVRADDTEICQKCANEEVPCRSCGKPSEDRSGMCLTCEPA